MRRTHRYKQEKGDAKTISSHFSCFVNIHVFVLFSFYISLYSPTLDYTHNTIDLSKLEKSLTTKTMMAKYSHRCKFLTQCIENKVVPKGLTARIQLNIPGNPSDRFKRRAQDILEKASLDAMTLLLGRYQGLIQELKTRNTMTAIKTNIEQKAETDSFKGRSKGAKG